MIKRYKNQQAKRVKRTRSKLALNPKIPRLTVIKSNKYIYAQIIDQETGRTLLTVRGVSPVETGEQVVKRALKTGIKRVVFDRGQYNYHGRIRLLAETARKGGIEF
uniref:Large ribosomal subunit protein uL18 n=1 Tax=uncultured Microgenomates bacterium Rifle_16ft_4_minimus_21028 TaxID=1665108 RepID=A0A0H4T4I4_9BACT|nr:50S ribosomal protein L18, large subunit ribosomal protein L18 [uncultured Microgenomates bacterium Rifle_16ft_4_minimus_21028]